MEVKRRFKVLLKIVAKQGDSLATLNVVNGLREDLEAMQECGQILDFAIVLCGEDPVLISLDEETEKDER